MELVFLLVGEGGLGVVVVHLRRLHLSSPKQHLPHLLVHDDPLLLVDRVGVERDRDDVLDAGVVKMRSLAQPVVDQLLELALLDDFADVGHQLVEDFGANEVLDRATIGSLYLSIGVQEEDVLLQLVDRLRLVRTNVAVVPAVLLELQVFGFWKAAFADVTLELPLQIEGLVALRAGERLGLHGAAVGRGLLDDHLGE